jgi:predicted O-linked N-acetylglucosamine transferase (SPINDLY family)
MSLHDTLNLAITHHAAGRLVEAERIYRDVLAHHPEQPIALCNLGRIAAATGHLDHAANLLTRAARLDPTNADCLGVLGEVFEQLGRLDDAIAAYSRARALKPDWVEVLNNLGHALLLKNRPAEAADALEHSLCIRPDEAVVHSNLAEAYRAQLRFRDAEAAARTAIRLDSNLPAAHGNLGNALHALGRFDDAVAAHREALRLNPNFIDAWNNLALALTMLRRYDEAINAYRRALAITPNPAAPQITAEIKVNLATLFMATDRLDDAIDAYRAALRLRPDLPHAHSNLGNALRERGLIDEALAEFRAALALRPDFALAHSNLLFAMYFHPDITNEQLLAEHRAWATRHADPLAPTPRRDAHATGEERDRRLRIGFVSPDFRDHPLGRFMTPLLENLDSNVICYSAAKRPDAITARLRAASSEWREIVGVTEPQLAEMIRADRVDVLVDLSLHSAANALLAFARRPAPVQVTYLGYAGTTGMAAMDFRLTDPHLDPPGADANYTERSLRLPRTYWCYAAPPEAPEVSTPPSQATGVVTFGCLNQFSKVSVAARRTWARILAAVPDSRLLLHSLPGRHREEIAAEFAAGGVEAPRIEWVGKLPIADYLATYNRIDIALDPFPYNGGTTTCDALWMGVPVVALAGNRAVARAGVSILTNVGLPELFARNADDYVRIAAALATDPPRLAELRRMMRDRVQSSPLMDAPAFARDFEEVIYRAWSERR